MTNAANRGEKRRLVGRHLDFVVLKELLIDLGGRVAVDVGRRDFVGHALRRHLSQELTDDVEALSATSVVMHCMRVCEQAVHNVFPPRKARVASADLVFPNPVS